MTGPAIDLVLSPFGAAGPDMVAAAAEAERTGLVGGVWTYDHLVGTMLGRGRSHDPFAVLGAVAATTERVRVGTLVANMMNRHPVALALSMATLQSLSDGRAVLGLGAGASPGSRFAAEHDAIGTELFDGPGRRRHLVETIEVVRAMWDPDPERRGHHRGRRFQVSDMAELVGDEARPPIVVGASGPATTELALDHADGVNLRFGPDVHRLIELVAERRPADFELSLHLDLAVVDDDALTQLIGLAPSVDRITVGLSSPFNLSAIEEMGRRLAESAESAAG